MRTHDDNRGWLDCLEALKIILRGPSGLDQQPIEDAIQDCGPAVLAIIDKDFLAVKDLAHAKLHTWPFEQVPVCWRRAFEDASLLQFENMVRDATATTQSLVPVLDMIIILTGAPGRRTLIDRLLECLERYWEVASATNRASRPLPDSFARPKHHMNLETSLYLVPRDPTMTLSGFESHATVEMTPVILTNVATEWPAFERWKSPAYLNRKALHGSRLVPVEIGRAYTDDTWGQRIMTFEAYLTNHLLNPAAGSTGYVAQHDLLDQIPSLSNDTFYPDHCYAEMPPSKSGMPQLDTPARNAWLGPAGTITPLHTDPYHNILCQVVGRKYVRLYAPAETPRLYALGVDSAGISMENTSQVDISELRKAEGGDSALLEKIQTEFPMITKARYVECILEAGEALYIPEGWWHYVESLEVSFNVSYWFN